MPSTKEMIEEVREMPPTAPTDGLSVPEEMWAGFIHDLKEILAAKKIQLKQEEKDVERLTYWADEVESMTLKLEADGENMDPDESAAMMDRRSSFYAKILNTVAGRIVHEADVNDAIEKFQKGIKT